MVSLVVSHQRDIQLQLLLLLKHSTNTVFCVSFGRADRPDLLRNGLQSRAHCPVRVAVKGRVVLAV